ncbi:MAG: GTP-binding protein [Nitrospirae bacterium]|nr:GTP-binding protein [Nitrospirota bacterium]
MIGTYRNYIVLLIGLLLTVIPSPARGQTSAGKVVDALSKRPIIGAIVTSGLASTVTDERGMFSLETSGNKVAVRAYGYLRAEQTMVSPLFSFPSEVSLVPFTPKALYLTVYGIGSRILRNSALKLLEETELNALVIDVKGDRGIIPYRSAVSLASQVGAQRIITVKDMGGLIRSLKAKGVYLIARIVVFKDDPFVLAKPGLAVRNALGGIWKDREGLAWADPFRKEVWDYNIDVAVEAARFGFDEIQFDYVRFPDAPGVRFSMPNTEENRIRAITGFLAEARRRLLPYNVFVGADIFGYVCWNLNDTLIGQKLEDLLPHLEYFSPMLYPSGFRFGIPGYRNPVAHPHEIVYLSLKNARERTRLPSVRFRPWLQSFRDYAFDRRPFTGKEIREQIDAAEKFGSGGWMLWNPQNNYSEQGLKRKNERYPSLVAGR